jgi:hypothetical protein
MPALADEAIESYRAYGLKVAEDDLAKLPEGNRRRIETFQKIRAVAEGAAVHPSR